MIKLACKTFACLLIIASLGACKSSEKQKATEESTTYIALAEKMMGTEVAYAFNSDRSYVLAQTDLSKNMDQKSFSFFVFEMKTEKVVLEKNVESGYVKWLSPTEVEVFRTPGKMRSDQTRDDYTEVYNVKTGDTTSKTEWKKAK